MTQEYKLSAFGARILSVELVSFLNRVLHPHEAVMSTHSSRSVTTFSELSTEASESPTFDPSSERPQHGNQSIEPEAAPFSLREVDPAIESAQLAKETPEQRLSSVVSGQAAFAAPTLSSHHEPTEQHRASALLWKATIYSRLKFLAKLSEIKELDHEYVLEFLESYRGWQISLNGDSDGREYTAIPLGSIPGVHQLSNIHEVVFQGDALFLLVTVEASMVAHELKEILTLHELAADRGC